VSPSDPSDRQRRPRPRPSRSLRESLFLRSGGICERDGCATRIDIDTFQVAHLRAHVNGGALVPENLGAWCSRCNLTLGPRDAGDTRVTPREWQLFALDRIVERVARTFVATVAAAPGAGKTVFASLVFEALRDADVVDRLVVLAPRATLVQQWHDSLYRARHVEIRPAAEVERRGQDGVVVTYQSLNAQTVGVHQRQAELRRTLFVLDEVHHVGEPDHSAWARWVSELVGDVEAQINVAGVLNLSGTLWRSKSAERISTVRYTVDEDGKIVSDVDYEVTATELIREGQLRPVDLYRRGATVELVNLTVAKRIISPIADLDDRTAGRAAIRELPRDDAWRESFVEAVLDCLEKRHRDLGNGPAKALIVARSQDDARAFRETADRIMRQRNMRPIAELAVSDEGDAHKTLERFRTSTRPGVLCTVDMAGEGYDCPDIAVVGFATNKLTPLYVRQVVARAQRVTAFEREKIGRPIPAAVVIPDVPQLVEVMSSILEPMRHEIQEEAENERGMDMHVQQRLDGFAPIPLPGYTLEGVADHVDGDVRVTGERDGDVAMELVRLVEPEARRVGLPESDAPRIIVAVRSALTERRDSRPFDPLSQTEGEMVDALTPSTPAAMSAAVVEPLPIERVAKDLRSQLGALGRWWQRFGDVPVAIFQAEVNNAGGIGPGGREDAEVAQLRAALTHARMLIGRHCDQHGIQRPSLMRERE
jgi:superfamily II DNA or RNA helicase